MGWAERITKYSATARSLRDLYRYARRDAASAATVLAFPVTAFAIICGATLPPLGSVVPHYTGFNFPFFLFLLVSGLMLAFFRAKNVGLGPTALYLLANLFFVHFVCGWLAWAMDFSSPTVYRTPLRGKQEHGGYTLDLRPFSSRQIPILRVHCLARMAPFPFKAERGSTLELDVWGSLCDELPDVGQGFVYVEEGSGILGTRWRRLSGDEPRSLGRGAKLEDHESWKRDHDLGLAEINARREAETKLEIQEQTRKFEERAGNRLHAAVSLATASSEAAAMDLAEKLSQCTGKRLEVVQNAYPRGFAVIRRFRSKQAAEAWAKKAKACSDGAEVQSLFITAPEGS